MDAEKHLNFLEDIVEEDIKIGKHHGRVHTRFPPEPNGYLHIGHAKSICLNFGLAAKHGGKTNLRFDDTNPETEETEYVQSIREDVQWLGFQWDNQFFASDYFEELYEFAIKLIDKNLAYVDDLSAEDIASTKGTTNEPGEESPYRNRSIDENLDLFKRMRSGEFGDGEKVLRARIDMGSPNMHMRDPIMYRIKHVNHHRTQDKWCIYPMYDFAHGQCDSLEKITHSLCTLEFEVHRPLYDWFIEKLEIFPSQQYEFARLNITYTVLSKRKLLQLVNEKYVSGWSDPRMPTLSGLRRRGYTAESIRMLCNKIGVQRRENIIDVELLEFCIREDLNKRADRRMVVLDPVRLVITNYPEGSTEEVFSENNPELEKPGMRRIPFSGELWIEREDFMEVPSKKFFRLAPGQMVRLKSAYIIRCESFTKEADGSIKEIQCTYIPESRSGEDTSGLNIKGTIHWVSIEHGATATVRLYDRLFKVPVPDADEGDFKEHINFNSLHEIQNACIEPELLNASEGEWFQFIRKGYFCVDRDSTAVNLVFNRTVTLKDNWSKQNMQNK
ncbi:MAG: glutamine--tRNA ligase/YqeY domain fusion protein [Chitinophagales bacterium]|nr:glutamine--tRNA ligase/YqeY domain fusion protein [Chitinophagales bacterium]